MLVLTLLPTTASRVHASRATTVLLPLRALLLLLLPLRALLLLMLLPLRALLLLTEGRIRSLALDSTKLVRIGARVTLAALTLLPVEYDLLTNSS